MINNKILIYIALLITFVRFFIPLHPDFDTLLIWLFILYLSPIILCIIAFKSDKLLATMVMIPNLMGIGYRLFIFFYDYLHLK
ncbi:hypothetical protein [Staphylococcus saccharolyticus]|uniref:Uncharacterized protein n=1 Tax=Staphylococcus saccharolyticus TaxID=33028 RepID=A0A380H8P2_9STAP|nr:hypothetical protein [Staphylococcus saccharolyticus]MBL7564378.1 hypothetical protein [Staphylococcus saccharolyticus]MBL7571358.1 hypothetical protein [Staphylococcus saccharolyticus]QQB99188.1 hypothetical protein I6I31_04905 [Staphylococcus saccharolyticus]QRJ66622.1 hypothetical protein DMB76_010950 [Staphylococcus saccharolyticus]RTX96600.1 hypothetical protein CD145_05555 [Staphylococcus saccharolyticus]